MYAALETDPRVGFRPGIVPLAGLGHIGGGGRRGWAPTLGGISADEAALLVADGLDSGDVSLASSLGATDSDAEAILALNNQDAEINALNTLIQNLNTGATAAQLAALQASGGAPSSSAAAAAQSPPGSVLTYNCSFNVSATLSDPLESLSGPSSVISAIQSKIAAYGLSIVSTQASSYFGNSFTVQVLDSVGHRLLTDAKSVLDAAVSSINGVSLISSQISLASAGGTNAAPPSGSPTTITSTPPPPAASLSTWFESNAATIGIFAVVALVAVSAVKKL